MLTKKQIKTAAIKIIAQEGFSNTTAEKIAQEAEVPLNTVYEYFIDIKEILKDIFTTEFQKKYSFYINIQNWHMDWFLKINGILNFHLQRIQEEPEIAIIILAERLNPCCQQNKTLDGFKQLSSIIAAILQQAIAEQKICSCNVQATALIVSGFLDALTYEFIMTKNIEQLKEAIDNFCLLLKKSLSKNGDSAS